MNQKQRKQTKTTNIRRGIHENNNEQMYSPGTEKNAEPLENAGSIPKLVKKTQNAGMPEVKVRKRKHKASAKNTQGNCQMLVRKSQNAAA